MIKKMFAGLFNPIKKKRKFYDIKLEQAMHAQRRGDIKAYAMLSAEAETLWEEILELEKQQEDSKL